MIKSIRYFLLVSILLSITIASAINGIGNYLLDDEVIHPFLDSQLIRVFSLVEILYQSNAGNPEKLAKIDAQLQSEDKTLMHKFFFQVWDSNGKLLLSSSKGPHLKLNETPIGFSDLQIHDNDWRIYTNIDKQSHAKIIVAELYNLRRELADDIARSNANTLLITYPVFGLLVWLIISFALRSIVRVTNEISNRASTYLEPVQLTKIPNEIKPLIAELNQLFIRLKLAFERNKRFAGDAAHELRTPLAALKTHVQVALDAKDEKERNKALQKVLESVDRSSHVVTQLLTLSRLGEEEAIDDIKPVDLHKLAIEIIAYLVPSALEKQVEIELKPAPENPIVFGNDIALGILIRNVVDNAIRYTPPHGEVEISLIETETHLIFRVTDTGTGIPPELRERVFERFFRILGTKAQGSGLGLAIVRRIASLHHADISLSTPKNGVGLQFDVAFPKHRA
jgi:two-component system sensor histidine kinase QseC